MKKSTRAAIRTARSLMAKGMLGAQLQQALQEAHPAMTPNQRTIVGSAIRKEVGVLGQVAHDPNLYQNCRQASVAKEQHPSNHTLIATYTTPMCATCDYNRKGSCSLMGGTLIAGAEGIDDRIVDRTASILVEEKQLTSQEANRITAAPLPPGKRAAALHLRRSLPMYDEASDRRAQQDSRRISSMMQNDTQVEIRPARTVGPRVARNIEDRDLESALDTQPGDERVSKRAASYNRVLQSPSMEIEIPGEPTPHRRDVRLAANTVFDVPLMDSGSHPDQAEVENDSRNVVQSSHDKLIRAASRLMASGSMTMSKAGEFITQLDALQEHGAVSSRRASRITTQLSALVGALEM